MNIFYKDIQNIIDDYKYSIEHYEKYKKCLKLIPKKRILMYHDNIYNHILYFDKVNNNTIEYFYKKKYFISQTHYK